MLKFGIALCIPYLLLTKIEATGEATTHRSEGYTLAVAKLNCATALRLQCRDGHHVPSIEYQEPACDESIDDDNARWWDCSIWCYGWCESE